MKLVFEDFLSNKRQAVITVVLIIVLALAATLFFLGFRVNKNLSISSPSTLILTNVSPNSTIIIDRRKASSKQNKNGEIVIKRLSSGEHEIIVSTKDHWPWTKRIDLDGNSTITLSPFTTPQNASGEIIPPTDPEYEKINSDINDNVPGRIFLSSDKKFTITTDINRIVAVWMDNESKASKLFCNPDCADSRIVFTAADTINGLAFYPNRDDVVLVAINQNIFALELDDNGIQNIQPIFTGTDPRFSVSTSTNTVFVKDQSTLFAVHI